MAASKAKPAKTTRPRRRIPIKGSKTEAILTLTATTPATPPQIAHSVNATRQLVHQVYQRYGIEPNTLESYKQHRADILAGKQEMILSSIDADSIKAMPIGQRIMSYGILYDKERLERDMSTSNVASVHADIAALRGQNDNSIEK
jgi:hypothetical protein